MSILVLANVLSRLIRIRIFISTDFLIQPGFKYKRLKDDAVPSIFEEFHKHLKKKSIPSRTSKTSLAAEIKEYPQFEESVMESENYCDVHIQTNLTSVEVTERFHNLQCNVDTLKNQVERQQKTYLIKRTSKVVGRRSETVSKFLQLF